MRTDAGLYRPKKIREIDRKKLTSSASILALKTSNSMPRKAKNLVQESAGRRLYAESLHGGGSSERSHPYP